MLNSTSCPPSSIDIWHVIGQQLFNGLTIPIPAVLLLLGLIGLLLVKRQLYWKQQFVLLGVVLLLFYLTTVFLPAADGANFVIVKFEATDYGATADAIVVLGRGEELRSSRVEIAAKLWKANRAPAIFASGVGDADEIVQLLQERGIPNQVINGEHCSKTTEENARFTAAALQPLGKKQIILVTDQPHMLRSLLIFRSWGFRVIPHPSPLPPSLAPREKAFLTYKEYIKLAGYGLLGRFFPRNFDREGTTNYTISPSGYK